MKPYPSYKDSRVEWIGAIPEHWERKKLGYIVNLQGRIGYKGYKKTDFVDEGEGCLVLGGKHINSSQKIDLSNSEFLSWDKYYESPEIMVKKGDLIISQRGSLGKVVFIDEDYGEMTINPSLVLVNQIKENPTFLWYYLQSNHLLTQIDLIGSVTTIPMLSQEEISTFQILIPPKREQTQIVSFLDHKTQKIDELIEKTEKKIELLKEKRTALINHCVTKGLNPDVELKDSGMPARAEQREAGGEWIGEIPKHWIVSKFKYLSEIVTGNTPLKTDEELYYTDSEDGFLWVKPTSLNKGLDYVNESEEHLTEEGKNQTRLISKDSTMICCIGNTIGKHSISGQELSTNQQINSVIPNQQKLHPWFCLFYVNVFTRDLLKWSNFVTLPIFTKSDLEDTPFILPPIEEQNEIVKKTRNENDQIGTIIEKEIQRIELLKEYRQALISEVVTGKIDVRGWKE